MAGHSKWANIKHKKARQDAKRGKVFTKLIREITISARLGGGDKDANPRLRAAVYNALANNMTKDTIERAIQKGAGSDESAAMMDIRYEGYGPAGVAIMVECMTDNKNRTVAEVRHAFSKCGGNLGTDGSVAYLFETKGLINFDTSDAQETIMDIAIDHGAEDISINDDNSIDICTDENHFEAVRNALIDAQQEPAQAIITKIASTEVDLDSPEQAEKLIRLTDMLEDLDDVQNVYSNASISDEVLAQLD